MNENTNMISAIEKSKEEPEVSDKIQDASHRIYNAMRKSVVECTIECEGDIKENGMLEDVHKKTATIVETSLPLKNVESDPNKIKALSLQNGPIAQPTFKPPRPPTPSHISMDKESGRPKNVISNVELNEGAIVANKLQNSRLLKQGLSKSVAANLNGELHSTSPDESFGNHSRENLPIPAVIEKSSTDNPSGTCLSA